MTLPSCYGVFWEAIVATPLCNEECGAKDECLAKFASGTLAEHQRDLGDAVTVAALAKRTGVCPEAILLAIDYQTKGAESPPVREPVVQDSVPALPPGIAPEEKLAAGVEELVESAGVPVSEPLPDPTEKAISEKKVALPKKVTSAKKVKPGKAGQERGKSAPKKKVSHRRRKKKESSANFPVAGAALPVAVPASLQKAQFVNPVVVPVESKSWGPEHDQTRWARERRRNPLVRKLQEGYALERRWPLLAGLGPIHRVIVGKQSYRYCGKAYPTLYAVMQAIVGLTSGPKQLRADGTRPEGRKATGNWSVTRFFSLEKIMLTLPEEHAGVGKCSEPVWPRHLGKKKRPPEKFGR